MCQLSHIFLDKTTEKKIQKREKKKKKIVIISSLWPAFDYSSGLCCGQSLNSSHFFFKAAVLFSFTESIQGVFLKHRYEVSLQLRSTTG